MMSTPANDDVVVRLKRGNPSTVYVLGTSTTPDQFILRTRDQAVSQALAFAKRQMVRAWFAKARLRVARHVPRGHTTCEVIVISRSKS